MRDLPPKTKVVNTIGHTDANGILMVHFRNTKASLCVDSSKQVKGLDYTESCVPVTQWSTIRLVMILAMILNLEAHQVDLTQAFTQVDLDGDIYM